MYECMHEFNSLTNNIHSGQNCHLFVEEWYLIIEQTLISKHISSWKYRKNETE